MRREQPTLRHDWYQTHTKMRFIGILSVPSGDVARKKPIALTTTTTKCGNSKKKNSRKQFDENTKAVAYKNWSQCGFVLVVRYVCIPTRDDRRFCFIFFFLLNGNRTWLLLSADGNGCIQLANKRQKIHTTNITDHKLKYEVFKNLIQRIQIVYRPMEIKKQSSVLWVKSDHSDWMRNKLIY